MSQKPTFARGSKCAVYGCKNYKYQKNSKSFFRMPRDLERLKKWIIACKRSDLDSLIEVKDPEYFYKNFVICSDHFNIECFRNKDLYSQGLLRNSIPTLNLSIDRAPLKRKSPCEESIVECAASSKEIKLISEIKKENEASLPPTVSSLQEKCATSSKEIKLISEIKKENEASLPPTVSSLQEKCAASSKEIKLICEIKKENDASLAPTVISLQEECAASSKKIKLTSEIKKENEAPLLPTVSSLQEENSKLHLIIQDYKKKLNNNCSLLSKYKKKCLLLKQKLLQCKCTNSITRSSKMIKVFKVYKISRKIT